MVEAPEDEPADAPPPVEGSEPQERKRRVGLGMW